MDDPKLPAREWICTHLAAACGLPVANCAQISIAGRSDVLFGSQWQGGTENVLIALPHVANPQVFSATLAFDFTSNNGDRHLNNYLYLRVNGEILIMLIDFSRALNFDGWPMPGLPISANTNTLLDFNKWAAFHPFIKPDAEKVVDRWNSLPDSKMEEILRPMPDEWMAQADRDILCAWWTSGERIVRGEDAKRSLP